MQIVLLMVSRPTSYVLMVWCCPWLKECVISNTRQTALDEPSYKQLRAKVFVPGRMGGTSFLRTVTSTWIVGVERLIFRVVVQGLSSIRCLAVYILTRLIGKSCN